MTRRGYGTIMMAAGAGGMVLCIAAGSFLIVVGVYQIVSHVLPGGDMKALFMILAGLAAIWIGVRVRRGGAAA